MWKLFLAAGSLMALIGILSYPTAGLPEESGMYMKRGGRFQTEEIHTMAPENNGKKPNGPEVKNVDYNGNINISKADTTPEAPLHIANSTASKNVHIIDTAFYMPQLNRYRRIWIYLPQDYSTSHKNYPVLYMQDGQNVFDEATSFAGEWGVDEALDSLHASDKQAIVVAIDNGAAKRINEYSPYDMAEYGKGEGNLYIDFLVHTLKPYIDTHYRTLRRQKHTFIAGSSLGALISFYAILKYPKVFGGAGIFSPAFWIAPPIKKDIEKNGRKVKGKIYFYAGKKESENMITDMLAVFNQLHSLSKADMTTVIREDGKHSESTWRNEFPLFYNWLMASQ